MAKTVETTFGHALHEALREEMARDGAVFAIGEDMRHSSNEPMAGLVEQFGENRVIDTPIAESSIVGAAIGAAMAGMRPVAEVMYAEFLPMAANQLANYASNFQGRTYGEATVPMVVRTRFGRGAHSHVYDSWFAHLPGWKIVMPSTPHDAKGMLKSAIREDCPVMFFEHMQLYREKGPVPVDDYTVPIGPAEVRREGGDVTVVASGLMVSRSLAAAETLAGEGIDTEVIDLRTLKPWDRDAVARSLGKTGRLVVVHESWTTGGIGGEIVARLMEDADIFSMMRGAPARSAALDVPVFDGLLEHIIPDERRIADAVRGVIKTP